MGLHSIAMVFTKDNDCKEIVNLNLLLILLRTRYKVFVSHTFFIIFTCLAADSIDIIILLKSLWFRYSLFAVGNETHEIDL